MPCGAEDFNGLAASPDVITKIWDDGYLILLQCRWRYGDPATRKTPFPPHRSLAGRFTDVEGRAGEGFFGFEGWFPHDHKGCQCSLEPVFGPNPNVPQSDLRKLNADRLAEYEANPRPGIDDVPEIVEAARDRFEYALARESEISRILTEHGYNNGATFHTYRERVKFEGSMRRKIRDEFATGKFATYQEAAESLKDLNRYTMVIPADDKFRATHKAIVDSLNQAGWETVKDVVAWAPGEPRAIYRGMNYVFRRGGDVVELQFSTPTAAAIKDQAHLVFEKWRMLPQGSPTRYDLERQMQRFWKEVPGMVPPNMADVGTQYVYVP
jgi:hypothetical protein